MRRARAGAKWILGLALGLCACSRPSSARPSGAERSLAKLDARASARARLDEALRLERDGQLGEARRSYAELVESAPLQAAAERALEAWLHLSTLAEQREVLPRWLKQIPESRLLELLHYRHAQSLESSDRREAVLAYEALALRYPLPSGVYTDEAIFRAALLRQKLGDRAGAESHLRYLSSTQAEARFTGSLLRSSAVAAQYTLGELLLTQAESAPDGANELRRFLSEHLQSRLWDDAQLMLALHARAQGQVSEACSSAHQLQERHSRFARCSDYLCGQKAEQPVDCRPNSYLLP